MLSRRGTSLPLATPTLHTTLGGRRPDRQGKVRDIYEFADRLLIVASDRISAFDYVLGSGIPDKGKVLTQISTFWFDRTRAIVQNHVLSIDPASFPEPARSAADMLSGRSMLVTRTEPLPIECVARGFLSGSGWKDYQATGEVCGHRLPAGLKESDRLPQPIFTPATKAETGHDINISEAEASRIVGTDVFERVRDLTLRLYAEGAAHAESCGIIVADTKFEFGLLPGDPRPAARTRRADRRSAHAGLVAVLAAGFVHSRADRNRASTSSSSATTSSTSAGTSSPRCPPCPTTSSRRRGRNTSRRFDA